MSVAYGRDMEVVQRMRPEPMTPEEEAACLSHAPTLALSHYSWSPMPLMSRSAWVRS